MKNETTLKYMTAIGLLLKKGERRAVTILIDRYLRHQSHDKACLTREIGECTCQHKISTHGQQEAIL